MINQKRFATHHGSTYLLLATILLALFAFDKISSQIRKDKIGYFSLLIYKITKKMFKITETKVLESNNIYSEIPAEDLMNEYRHTLESIKEMVSNNELN